MKIRGALIFIASLLIGSLLIGVLGSWLLIPRDNRTTATAEASKSAAGRATPVQTAPPIPVDAEPDTALLIFDSRHQHLSDSDFLRVAAFYGLTTSKLDLATTPLTDATLRDTRGHYYRTVFAVASNLDTDLKSEQLNVLQSAIRDGGLNLMLGSVQQTNSKSTLALTDHEIVGSKALDHAGVSYHVSQVWPDITRELTGITVRAQDNHGSRYALNTGSLAPHSQPLISSLDAGGANYDVFDIYSKGKGQVFISSEAADPTLSQRPLNASYAAQPQADGTYLSWGFGQVVPLMMFVRYTAGDLAWHQNHDYANFTIDDPPLRTSQIDYSRLEKYAALHNFHVSIAMPPVFYNKSEPGVVSLFLQNPDRLSMVQHGNNHSDYEFYKYTVGPNDPYPAQPLAEQEANVVEGATRMEAFTDLTGIPYARTMIFPSSTPPLKTLSLLKEYNFQATINALDHPLDVAQATSDTADMYPAELEYANFAMLSRTHAQDADYPFDLFLGKPALIYEHGDFFKHGYTDFDSYADSINAVQGKVEWESIDYIVKHLYLERADAVDARTRYLKIFGNDIVANNESTEARTYFARREETGNVPIAGVTLDDKPVQYSLVSGVLQVKFSLEPGQSTELKITYHPPDRDFSIGPQSVTLNRSTGVISVTVSNTGKTAGPAPVGIFGASGQRGRTLLALATARQIQPGASTTVTATLALPPPPTLTVTVDPYDVIGETNENNNTTTISTGQK